MLAICIRLKQMTYKTAKTCIKHLQTDMRFKFHHENFDLFRNHEGVALEAIKCSHGAYEYIGDELKTLEFACKALEINPDVYLISRYKDKYSHDQRYNELSAKCGRYLYFASDEIKNNKKYVLISIRADGGTLAYASKELQDSEDIVLEAVKQKPYSINYASSRIQQLCKGNDPEKFLESKLLHDKLQQKMSSNPGPRPNSKIKL